MDARMPTRWMPTKWMPKNECQSIGCQQMDANEMDANKMDANKMDANKWTANQLDANTMDKLGYHTQMDANINGCLYIMDATPYWMPYTMDARMHYTLNGCQQMKCQPIGCQQMDARMPNNTLDANKMDANYNGCQPYSNALYKWMQGCIKQHIDAAAKWPPMPTRVGDGQQNRCQPKWHAQQMDANHDFDANIMDLIIVYFAIAYFIIVYLPTKWMPTNGYQPIWMPTTSRMQGCQTNSLRGTASGMPTNGCQQNEDANKMDVSTNPSANIRRLGCQQTGLQGLCRGLIFIDVHGCSWMFVDFQMVCQPISLIARQRGCKRQMPNKIDAKRKPGCPTYMDANKMDANNWMPTKWMPNKWMPTNMDANKWMPNKWMPTKLNANTMDANQLDANKWMQGCKQNGCQQNGCQRNGCQQNRCQRHGCQQYCHVFHKTQ